MAEKSTRVVSVKVGAIRPGHADLRHWMADPQNVYVGRRGIVFIDGARFPPGDSPWANPFRIGPGCTRADAIARYRTQLCARLAESPALRIALAELRGKTLGCWCAPEACHADVLAELADASR